MFEKAKEFAKKHKIFVIILVIILLFLLYIYMTKGEMSYMEAIKSTFSTRPSFLSASTVSM